MNLDLDEITQLTDEYGGKWGINHSCRLLKLIEVIGQGQIYNSDAVWLAAHLHDWGAYPEWAQQNVDHAVRSTQVADAFLTERGCPQGLKELVLECIRLHHIAERKDRTKESILLFDADALDFLGVVGILRDFSKNTKDLRKAFEITKKRRKQLPGLLFLEKSKELAVKRIKQMDEFLELFEQDSWGNF